MSSFVVYSLFSYGPIKKPAWGGRTPCKLPILIAEHPWHSLINSSLCNTVANLNCLKRAYIQVWFSIFFQHKSSEEMSIEMFFILLCVLHHLATKAE